MHAKWPICTNAVSIHNAKIPLALMIVLVLKDSVKMASHVMMLMSAKTMATNAVFMHTAITL